MKRPFKFTEMSTFSCARKGCGKFIKANLVARNPLATLCYQCWQDFVRQNPYKTTKGKKITTNNKNNNRQMAQK